MENDPSKQKYSVPSVDSACRILKAICEASSPIRLPELVKAVGSSRTTVMRIVSSLCAQGFLSRTEQGHLTPGQTMNYLGTLIREHSDLRTLALPLLKEISKTEGETAHLAVPAESHCMLQEVVESVNLVRVASQPGTLVDYHCSATGKAMMAFDKGLAARLKPVLTLRGRTSNTHTSWDTLEEEFEIIRRRGFAVDEEEYHPGVRCVGVPIISSAGSAIGAIGITGTTQTVTPSTVSGIAKRVMILTKDLGRSAG